MTISKGEDLETIRKKLKELLVSNLAFLNELDPLKIKDDEILFGDGLGLDSLDAVEIVVLLQRNFGLDVRDMKRGREIFYSIDTLSRFIYESTRK
ncbi:MAG: phosphopantetheine-binding protein [Candidatus Omnitrophota bacterium]